MNGTGSLADREMGRVLPPKPTARSLCSVSPNDWMKDVHNIMSGERFKSLHAYRLIEESVNLSQSTGSRREAESALRKMRAGQRR
jgi:hypothetical protein